MKIQITYETPDGMVIGNRVTDEYYDALEAATSTASKIEAGYSQTIAVSNGAVLLPNKLLRVSVIKFRNASGDKDVPF